jgi:hypothetical protein
MQEDIRADLTVNTSKVFKLRDVFFPEVGDVMGRATPELKLRGRIIDFSDSGRDQKQYAIVEVEGIDGPLVVPVAKLKAVWEEDQADARIPE